MPCKMYKWAEKSCDYVKPLLIWIFPRECSSENIQKDKNPVEDCIYEQSHEKRNSLFWRDIYGQGIDIQRVIIIIIVSQSN